MIVWAIILVVIAVVCFIARNRVGDQDAHLVLTIVGWLAAILAFILLILLLVGSVDEAEVDADALLLGPLSLLTRATLRRH